MIHKYLNPFFITIFFFLLISQTLSIENKIIVKLDNQIITSLELKNKIRTNLILSNQEINQKNIDKVKSIALNALINFKIKEFEIKKYGVEKTRRSFGSIKFNFVIFQTLKIFLMIIILILIFSKKRWRLR